MAHTFKKLLKMGELKCVAIKSPGLGWSQNLNPNPCLQAHS